MAVDRLVDSAALDTGLTAVANAIRAKGGTTSPLEFPDEMAQAVSNISGETIYTIDYTYTQTSGTSQGVVVLYIDEAGKLQPAFNSSQIRTITPYLYICGGGTLVSCAVSFENMEYSDDENLDYLDYGHGSGMYGTINIMSYTGGHNRIKALSDSSALTITAATSSRPG